MFNSNCGCILHHFPDFDYEEYCNLEIQVGVTTGHRRSYPLIAWLWFPISIL